MRLQQLSKNGLRQLVLRNLRKTKAAKIADCLQLQSVSGFEAWRLEKEEEFGGKPSETDPFAEDIALRCCLDMTFEPSWHLNPAPIYLDTAAGRINRVGWHD